MNEVESCSVIIIAALKIHQNDNTFYYHHSFFTRPPYFFFFFFVLVFRSFISLSPVLPPSFFSTEPPDLVSALTSYSKGEILFTLFLWRLCGEPSSGLKVLHVGSHHITKPRQTTTWLATFFSHIEVTVQGDRRKTTFSIDSVSVRCLSLILPHFPVPYHSFHISFFQPDITTTCVATCSQIDNSITDVGTRTGLGTYYQKASKSPVKVIFCSQLSSTFYPG